MEEAHEDNSPYGGEERRAADKELRDVKLEMAQVRSAMTAAVADLVTQESLNRTAKRAATRLSTSWIILAVAVMVGGSLLTINQNKIEGIARDAKVAAEKAQISADTLNDCLLVGGTCYKRLAEQGTQGSVRTMKFTACWATMVPEARSLETMIACAKKVYPEITTLEQQLRDSR